MFQPAPGPPEFRTGGDPTATKKTDLATELICKQLADSEMTVSPTSPPKTSNSGQRGGIKDRITYLFGVKGIIFGILMSLLLIKILLLNVIGNNGKSFNETNMNGNENDL